MLLYVYNTLSWTGRGTGQAQNSPIHAPLLSLIPYPLPSEFLLWPALLHS